MLFYKEGDLLEADVDNICHQVNCQGVMGAGIARQIRRKWPCVYEDYRNWVEAAGNTAAGLSSIRNFVEPAEIMLGTIRLTPVAENKNVISMASQEFYGHKENYRYTSYDAFVECLVQIKVILQKGSSIGFPYLIGCGLGGGNWNIISTMIDEILGEDYKVFIYFKKSSMSEKLH